MVEDGRVEGGQRELRAEPPAGLVPEALDLQLAGEVGQRLPRHDDVPVDLGGHELRRHGDVVDGVVDGPFAAPAERVHAGVHDQPDGAHQGVADRAELAALAVVQPCLVGKLLGVQAPAFREHGQAALALQRRQAGQQLQARQLKVMAGHRLVEGHGVDVPSGAGRGPLGVEPERSRPPAVQARRGVVRRRAAERHDVRHGRHLAGRRERGGEEFRRLCLGPPHGGQRPADRLLGRDLPGRLP